MSEVLRDEGTKEQALRNTRRLLSVDPISAERQARIIIERDPCCFDAHTLLGIALRQQDRPEDALEAEQNAINLSMREPKLFEALMTLSLQQLEKCEMASRKFLEDHPQNAAAMRLLAEVAARMGRFDQAEQLLDSALSLAPSFDRARLLQKNICRLKETSATSGPTPIRSTIEWTEALSGETPTDEALHIYEIMAQEHPDSPETWVSYGHLFRTIGEQDEAVARYRRAITARATFGEAWYSIGDLKAARYDPEDLVELDRLSSEPNVSDIDRAQLHFARGRAFEQFGDYENSFQAYAVGNRIKANNKKYEADSSTWHVERSISVFDSNYFVTRAGAGEHLQDPIFILGLPRAGSTLLEQILASHSRIEPTGELTIIANLANSLGRARSAGLRDSAYDPEAVATVSDSDLQRFGRAYIWDAGLRRQTSKPHFLDKMPNNWMHLGFILSILPNAKIIDARRHPMACCFSNFRQHFAAGQEFTYDLNDLGRFYRDYVRMMAHFDRELPGRIHRVIHEDLVADPEAEVRRMLDYIGVPFEESCLRFYENKRAVRTASSEQVRRPINSEGVDQWRNFEPWLGELRQALGSVVDAYPGVPADLA